MTLLCLGPTANAVEQDPSEPVEQDETPPPEELSEPAENPESQERDPSLREDPVTQVQAAVSTVNSPDLQLVAKALAVTIEAKDSPGGGLGTNSLEPLGDLDGDGVPELALRWTGLADSVPEAGGKAEAGQSRAESGPHGLVPAWILFLLSWDGTRWIATRLMDTANSFTLQVEPLLGRASRVIVVQIESGAQALVYPVICQFKNHTATLLWDSRADESRYQALVRGQVEFRDLDGDGVRELLAFGRADPGLLVFSKTGKRGFEARAIYTWDGKAYVPRKTEYSVNADYTLYRFISALHLHDFRGAYALIDPPKFLKSGKPSLTDFQKQVETSWPEFLRDSIFQALDPAQGVGEDFAFRLVSTDKTVIYKPSFGGGPKFLLTGLERREEKYLSLENGSLMAER